LEITPRLASWADSQHSGGGSNGTSPQPLSKVRTSFVAVERSGQLGAQWGLRKESSTDPSLATRRASFSIDEETDPKAIADRKQSINTELSARKSSAAVTETIPESAIETPPIDSEKRSGYLNGSSGRGKAIPAESKPSANPDKKTSVEDRHAKLLPGDTTSSAAVSGGAALRNSGGFGENLNGNTSEKLNSTSPTKAAAKTAPAGQTARPGPISITPSLAAAKAVPKLTKSPSVLKTPTTPAKTPTTPGLSGKATTSKPAAPSSKKSQAKPADMKATKSTASSSTTSKPAARPTTSSTIASTSENKPPHTSPTTGFHKPKPKSPTRPAKLPASMTAPTASSLSKVATAAAPSRQSLAPSTKTVSRSRSHASLSQKQELHHKPSKLESDRPVFGRPSTSTLKKQPSRQSLPKQPAPTDESFLARMMRPTTSSASKTTEKVITPPRARTNTRPTTREGPVGHKPHQGLKGSPSTKKLPAAAKETKNEGLNAAHSSKVEGIATSASGISQAEPAHTEEEAAIPFTTDDGPITTSTHEDKPTEEVPVEDSTTFTSGLTTATEDISGANQPAEKLINYKDPKPDEASQSVEENPNAEKVVDPDEVENPASQFIEATVDSVEPAVADESKLTEPNAHGTEDHATMNSVSEQSKEEYKTGDTASAA